MSVTLREINTLQTSIMLFIKEWANVEKTPIPQREIITNMTGKNVNKYTALQAVHALLDKGYIRRAYSPNASRTFYVMIRNI